MITTIRYILLTALRDWLFIGLFLACFCAIGIANFLGSTALVEEAEMTIVYIGGSTRLILIIGLITFVCFHVRRAFDNREIEVIISRPISRFAFVIAYWMGFACVALLLTLPLIATLGILFPVPLNGLLYWGGSLLLETFLVVAIALFASLIMRSAVSSVIFCFGFYFVCRIMGFLLYVLEQPHLLKSFDLGWLTGKAIFVVSAMIPRLDMFAESKWLIYGMAGDASYQWFLPQTLVYIPLLLLMAVYDFKRKQF